MQNEPTLVYGSLRTDVSMNLLSTMMEELSSILNRPGVGFDVRLRPMDGDDIEAISSFDSVMSLEDLRKLCYRRFYAKYGVGGRAAIVCHNDHPFARAVKAKDRFANWGRAILGQIALTYGETHKEIIWHETLHVLGADDCYDKSDPVSHPEPRCELANCIHRYDPGSTTVDVNQWPFICRENLSRIQTTLRQDEELRRLRSEGWL